MNKECMYGWYLDSEEKMEADTFIYDFSPCAIQTVLCLPLQLCKIVSDYTANFKCLTFEVWERYPGQIECNWFGTYTFGTAWFRGCKVWLMPRTGFVFNDMKRLLESESLDYIQDTVSSMLEKHLKRREMNYNEYNSTSFQPFRLRDPKEMAKELEYMTLVTGKECIDYGDALKQSVLLTDLLETKAKIYMDQDMSCKDDDSAIEGGVNLVLVHDQENLINELEWIQELGEQEHGITFQWI